MADRRTRQAPRAGRRSWVVPAAVVIVALATAAVWLGALAAPRHQTGTDGAPPLPSGQASATASATPRPVPSAASSPKPVPSFDKHEHSIDDPASIWVVADKRRSLNPVDYAPDDLVFPDVRYVNRQPLRADAAAALVALFAAGRTEAGLEFQVQSAYRSYDTQVAVYNGWVRQLGRKAADLTSARPGTSEHQTGLAVDISSVPAVCPVEMCFADTPQAKWLAANAWRFGFILRYPRGKTAITGYEYEPYHFRYVGTELAAEMRRQKVSTLEEFFGLPPAPDYP